ncbi:MAG TPA: DUF441 domain-containing protein [Firmicutes bacterium]|jgi:uncharacterized membrane protein (DUF441 family)|nr:DUF441 domain-containing protein [Bacillota bacterium]
MFQDNLLLIIILALGLVFNNSLVAASAGSLLVLKFIKMTSILLLLERRAVDLGLLFLLVAVLAPFALDKVKVEDIWKTFQSIQGIVAVIGGVAAAYLCGQGMVLLQVRPEIVVGLVVGTIIGVSLLKGIPVGPLAAAGVTAIILNLLGLGKR